MTHVDQSSAGFDFSKEFVEQLNEKELRDAYMADRVKTRIALLIRALREQDCRQWSQTELGRRAGKPPNVISRIEDPEYGKLTLTTLLEVASAFDLPLIIDMPEWENWFTTMQVSSPEALHRHSFDLERLSNLIESIGSKEKVSQEISTPSRAASIQSAIQDTAAATSVGLTTRLNAVDVAIQRQLLSLSDTNNIAPAITKVLLSTEAPAHQASIYSQISSIIPAEMHNA